MAPFLFVLSVAMPLFLTKGKVSEACFWVVRLETCCDTFEGSGQDGIHALGEPRWGFGLVVPGLGRVETGAPAAMQQVK